MTAEWNSKEPCILGIDEAGRGPCLGPMVYSAAYCAKTDLATLKALGVNDSKQLTKGQRDDFREKLDSAIFLGSDTLVLHASELSAKMLRPAKYNLNAISHDSALSLVERALARGVNVKEVYVDTVGDPAKYAAMFRDSFPTLEKVVVEKKADGTYPIVGAASIIAKTTRDKCVSSWAFKEEARSVALAGERNDEDPNGAVSYDRDYGSGYPSDPKCKSWLTRNVDNVFGYPSFVRFSWGTTKRILDADAVQVTWECEDEEEGAVEEEATTKKRKHAKIDTFFSAVPSKKKKGLDGGKVARRPLPSFLQKIGVSPYLQPDVFL